MGFRSILSSAFPSRAAHGIFTRLEFLGLGLGTKDNLNMAGLNQNPTALSRIFRAINVLGLSCTPVRSVADGVFRFVTGVRAESPNPDRANTMELDDAMNFENFSTCIDNMNFMYPEIFSGVDSFTSFNEFCVTEGLSYSAL